MKSIKSMLLLCVAAGLASATVAQEKKPEDKPKPPAAKPEEKKEAAKPGAPGAPDAKQMAEMMAAYEKLGAPGENHKLLESHMVGDWTYTNKMWHGPEPTTSTGTATTKALYGGRYFVSEHKGKMPMPGPDGKMTEKTFEGTATTGYDNATGKFWGTWIDSMSTCAFHSTGTYDPATKTFTYTGSTDMGPLGKCKVREVIKIIDKNKHTLEWYETQEGAPEQKTMEITYTRKGASS
jgi:hypothetical protein